MIDSLEFLIDEDCADTQYDFIEEIKYAIKVLKKQIAVKPTLKVIDEEMSYCKYPNCESSTVLYRGCRMRYCKQCGQKLDWRCKKNDANAEQLIVYDIDNVMEQMEERTSFLKDCSKHEHQTEEQREKSYSTMMMYEVADLVNDLIEIVKDGKIE